MTTTPAVLRTLLLIAIATTAHTGSAAGQEALKDTKPRRGCNTARALATVENGIGRIKDAKLPPHCLTYFEIFADGNVKDVIGASTAGSLASGALGMRIEGNRFNVSGLVNVAGTQDTVRSGFGATMLAPATGKSLNAASLEIRGRARSWGDRRCLGYDYDNLCNVGYRLAATATSRTWATETAETTAEGSTEPTTTVTAVSQVPLYGIDVGLSYEFFRGTIKGTDDSKKDAAMLLDIGVSRRAIRGDLGAKSDAIRAIRERTLGSTQRTHHGAHASLLLAFNQIRSEFTYLWLDGATKGLSGGQVIAAVSLRAAIVSGLFRRD